MRVVLALLVFAVAAAVFAFSAPSANAAPASGSVPAVDTTPAPTDSPQSIGVWVRIAADKSNVPNVSVTVTGKGVSLTVVTGADGKVTVPLAKPGTYKLAIDKSTLPDGQKVLGQDPREVAVSTGNQGVPGYFLLGDGNTGAVPSASASPGAGSSDSGGSTKQSIADVVLPRIATGLIFGLLIALASIGVSLIYGTTGLNNFAHGELVTFGALAGYVVAGPLHLPGWFGIIVALVLGGAFGYLQDLGLWKPLRKKGVGLIPLMIVSIGLSLALRYIFQFIFGPDLLVTPNNQSSVLNLGPIHLRSTDISSPIICIVVLLLVAFALLRTRIGKATRAVADNRSLAAATGINVERVIRIVWVAGGALAGLSGALIGYYQPVSWQTGASILLLIFASVTLGGLGTAFGALVGSLVIGLIVDLSQAVGVPSNMKFVAALLVMIIILIFRPQGILGRKDRIG
ncbi:branched-chain amino acid ABC transporter permease [Lacisediminihabitans changchengi]|uniref:branched-chain amino acid ABC transporter permease n=1 Tax=Lacisediminihabitans changchengi TaxID=2787634 RepID=UPI001F2FCF9F|nr:branched-chain amino acid ABC transporter permease [Lacisediminihabitans changchengi]